VILVWSGLGIALVVPMTYAATSEYLAWRDPVYIAAGFAGVIALCLVLVQPLLGAGWLPGMPLRHGRRAHRALGIALVSAVVVHVAALWFTSPPDIEDALLLRSPTPFSIWGVVALWTLLAAAIVAAFRRRLAPQIWRLAHTSLAGIAVLGGAVHAMLIEGTMEPISKAVLCALAIIAALAVMIAPRLRVRRRVANGELK
jgi:predicted ferric reductase